MREFLQVATDHDLFIESPVLGRSGEDLAIELVVDVRDWKLEGASFTILMEKSSQEVALIATGLTDELGRVGYVLGSEFQAEPDKVRFEVSAKVGEQTVISAKTPVIVIEGSLLSQGQANEPTPEQSGWQENLTELANTAVQAKNETTAKFEEISAMVEGLGTEALDTHKADTDNPHKVSYDQLEGTPPAIDTSEFVTKAEQKAGLDTKSNDEEIRIVLDTKANDSETKIALASKANLADLNAYVKTNELPSLSPYALKTELPVVPDISGLAAKTELNNYATRTSLSEFATKAELANVSTGGTVDQSNYATKTEQAAKANLNETQEALAGKLDKTELPKPVDLTPYVKSSELPSPPDLSGYATKTELNNKANTTELEKYALKTSIPAPPDLSSYATKNELNTKANAIETNRALDNKANKSELAVFALKTDIVEPDLSDYAKASDLTNKVDKVANKQLSTNDYTTAEKSKLASLTDYTLPTATTTSLGGIKIGNNLTITEDGTLSAPAPTNISGLATKTEQATKANSSDLEVYAKKADVPDTKDFATKSDISTQATKAELANVSSGGSVDLSGYATTTQVEQQLKTKANASDLTNLATKTEQADYLKTADLPAPQDLSGYATKTEQSAKANKTSLDGQATKTELATKANDSVVQTALATKANSSDLENYALKSSIPVVPDLTPYAKLTDLPTVPDVSGFATKESLETKADLDYVNTALSSKVDNSALNDLVDAIYPIGMILEFANSTNPNTLYPWQTWEEIFGKFLFARDATYPVGDEGGSTTHKLTVAEMPYHAHITPITDSSITTGSGGTQYKTFVQGRAITGTIYIGEGSPGFQGSTTPMGNNAPHNNMPPYQVVGVWKRTK